MDLTACEFCPLGQYNVNTGSAKPSDCKDCKAGKYANSIIRPATTSSASAGTSTGGTFAQRVIWKDTSWMGTIKATFRNYSTSQRCWCAIDEFTYKEALVE